MYKIAQKKRIKKKVKIQLNTMEDNQEAYYLNDAHIWKVIDKLESNVEYEKNKSLLIDYLSCLVKFDWERAKIESSINKKTIFSIFVEILSVALMIFNFGNITSSNIIALVVFLIIYALPILSVVLLTQSMLIKKSYFRMVLKMFFGGYYIFYDNNYISIVSK